MTLRLLEGLAGFAEPFDACILDLWGVVHNGKAPYSGAIDCMRRLREAGKQVLLLSNAPRRSREVVRFLDDLGVPRDAYDDLLTSGDLTREELRTGRDERVRRLGGHYFQIGPKRDWELIEGLTGFKRVGEIFDATFILCTGLFDDTVDTPEEYTGLFRTAIGREMMFVCANPDLVVMRGGDIIHCAGALASLYEELGGEVISYGKPYRRTYEVAMERLGIRDPRRVLAVGDSLRTDVAGAMGAGIDIVLVTCGIHAEEWGVAPGSPPSLPAIERHCADVGVQPSAVMAELRW